MSGIWLDAEDEPQVSFDWDSGTASIVILGVEFDMPISVHRRNIERMCAQLNRSEREYAARVARQRLCVVEAGVAH